MKATEQLHNLGQGLWLDNNYVAEAVAQLIAALEPEEVVLGGGNVKKLTRLPPNCSAGDNANAFLGGFRLWDNEKKQKGFKLFNPRPQKNSIERKIVYADRNDRPWKNGRQYGAKTFARRPRLRGFRYVGEGGGGTGSRESDRGG